MQRLSAFIRENFEPILAEWEEFARTISAAEGMDVVALRDHAREMLGVIAADLDKAQTDQQQSDKGMGHSDADASIVFTAAQKHGAGRAESGFTVGQMVAEFRALRASVLRLWCKANGTTAATDFGDLIRFNEAIDQAIAESITRYTGDVSQSKERFLAILGHDLRNPVGAVITSTSFMLENAQKSRDLPEPYLSLAEVVLRSGRRMNQMVTDLLEFARVSFGQSIPIERIEMDIEPVLREVADEVRASNPGLEIKAEFEGDLRGEWDRARIFQALTNLLGNAIQHGDASRPVVIEARGEPDKVAIAVCNEGPKIADEQLGQLFEGMRGVARRDYGDRRHLGLGLYIVDKIVAAHGGAIDVQSSDERGTKFILQLPRRAGSLPS